MLKAYEEKNASYYNHARPELIPFLPEKFDIVLDVGCGAGNFGLMLKDLYNCTVWGIEPDPQSSSEAKKKLQTVINAPFNNELNIPPGQKFDCIFFNDVLEHLADPGEALLLASKMLTEDGCVIASIPNIRFYPVMLSLIRYKDFKYLDAGVMDKTHLRFFTEKSMMRLFEENGYVIKKMQGINKHKFKYFEILNGILFNRLQDMRYPQFAIVASKKADV